MSNLAELLTKVEAKLDFKHHPQNFDRRDGVFGEALQAQCPRASERREVLKMPVGVVTPPTSATFSKVVAS